ncbi:hypothetical protein ACFL2Q_10510 [Thermodesulfobacteriota bacterium]
MVGYPLERGIRVRVNLEASAADRSDVAGVKPGKGVTMKFLNPPKGITWWICLVLCALGILLQVGYVQVPAVQKFVFWIPVAGLVIMLLATRFKGL